MENIFHIDWEAVFVPSVGLLEIFFRGTVIYLMIFILLRVMRRQAGSFAITNILFIVLIADASQNAMSSEYKSITEGALLILTIAFWEFMLDWLSYRSIFVSRLVRPPPLLLIMGGRMVRRNMRQEMITEDELISHLRQQGIEDIGQVKKCYMEDDGHISVLKQ